MNAPVHFDPAADAYTTPLDQIDVSDPRLFQDDVYHPYFERLRALRDQLAEALGPLPVLSMGMSGDFEVAIACGATHVRIGTAIFGARAPGGGGET